MLGTLGLVAVACDRSLVEPEAEPPTPTGLVAAAGDEEVLLSWDLSLGGATFERFRVFQGTSPDDLVQVGATLPSQPTYTASGLTNGSTYYFAVATETLSQVRSPRTLPVQARPESRYRLEGLDMGSLEQSVSISRKSQPVDGADVEVNGESLAGVGAGRYHGILPVALQPGDLLTVLVRVGDATLSGEAPLPDAAIVVSPENGASFTSTQAFTIRWESPRDPDRFEVLLCWEECQGARRHQILAGDRRSVQVSMLGLPVDQFTEYAVHVLSINDGTFSGRFEDGSRLGVRTRAASPSVPTIVVAP